MPSLTAESSATAVAAFDDDAWEDLLNYIEEKRVIPIVGPELAMVQTDAGPVNLYAWLARALATRLGIGGAGQVGGCPHPATTRPPSRGVRASRLQQRPRSRSTT